MSAARRDRLEAQLAALHSSAVPAALKPRLLRWQRYAALTGSAVALATNAPLSTADPTPLAHFGVTQNEPLLRSVKLAAAARRSKLFATAAAIDATKAALSQAPAISAGGVVSLYSTVNRIQPGSWVSIYGTNLAPGIAA